MIYPKAFALLERFSKKDFLKENRAALIGGTKLPLNIKIHYPLNSIPPLCVDNKIIAINHI